MKQRGKIRPLRVKTIERGTRKDKGGARSAGHGQQRAPSVEEKVEVAKEAASANSMNELVAQQLMRKQQIRRGKA